MRFFNKFNIIRYTGLFLTFILLTVNLPAQEKAGKKQKQKEIKVTQKEISITLTVKDKEGSSVPGAQIVVGEGVIHGETDENGLFSFTSFPGDFVTISSAGYNKRVAMVESLVANSTIELDKAKLFMTSDDIVPMPFLDMKKRNITGSSIVITGEQLEKYPGTDVRNSFTGLANGLEVRELNGSPGISAEEQFYSNKISLSMRGNSPMFIIDGVPTDLTEMPVDASEIESVTVIKDIVGKAMFGPAGANGILLINTRRGKMNERVINVNAEKGVSIIDRMPEWSSGADYARLNNLSRTNSGITPLYSDDDISAFSLNNPYDMYHPSIDFKDLMLKNTKSFNRANVSTSGGNDAVQYFGYLGYSGEGDIFKIGSVSDNNYISTRSNIDIKINDFLKLSLGIYGGIGSRRSPNYGTTYDFIELDPVLNNIQNIPPVQFPVYANNSPELEKPWYAVSANYGTNPIGGLEGNGYYYETTRNGASNLILDYDMSAIVKGLSSKTHFGFNVYNMVRLGKQEDYSAYTVTPSLTSGGADTILLALVHNGVVASAMSKLSDYYFQRFSVDETLMYEKSFGKSNLQNSLTYFLTRVSKNGIEEPQRQQNVVWSGVYSYDDKYTLQGVLNYAGTYSFNKDNRTDMFPSVGASWVISEEGFMKSMKFINFLKLRAEAGILGYDDFRIPYRYRDNFILSTGADAFGPYPVGTWFGTTKETLVTNTRTGRIGNPDLTWEKRKEFNVGFDALLLSGKLSLEVNYFNNLHDGIITALDNTTPDVIGLSGTLPIFNYKKIRYYGVETGLSYAASSGKFSYSFGGNITIQNSNIIKSDEPDYRYDYQSSLGKSNDSYFGLKYIGKFQTDDEALVIPQIYDDVLHAGDLKYEDMNSDGFIDDNDKTIIGNTTPRLIYAINAYLKYKGFDLTIIGTGRALYDIPLTNEYYLSGWGDNNYSGFVRDNVGGAYPELTYYKVNNNFIGSDFWLTKGGFFKIQNVEIGYNVPGSLLQKTGAGGIRFFVRGANLYTISKLKDVDPESINSGVSSYPLFITCTGGIKLTF
ncbi:MAG: SusC/RagA family TonB-linked outer membrane protein [Bacteroidia bacterium]|nr:SusC/RagA family TonB-linked outer membrane protein [Bacteroidia bacterium]